MKKIFLLLVFLSFLNETKAQLSKIHYIPPITTLEYNEGNNASAKTGFGREPGDQWIYISTPSKTDVSYTIKIGGALGTTADSGTIFTSGTVNNDFPKEISIVDDPNDDDGWWSNFAVKSNLNEQILSKGFIIEATSEIYVSIRLNGAPVNGSQYHAGALVSKGLSGLGTRFRAGMFKNRAANGGQLGFISVMATEDQTTVSFDLKEDVYTTSGLNDYSITLNKAESFVLSNQDYEFSLIGTLVTSDKPIVMNSGSATGSFAESQGGQDYGIDQIVGSKFVGSEYIIIRGNGEN